MNSKITAMRRAQNEEIRKVMLACDKRVNHERELAQSQVPIFALSLVERQSMLMNKFVDTSRDGLVEVIAKRKTDISLF